MNMNKQIDYTFMNRINEKTNPEWKLMKESDDKDGITLSEGIVYTVCFVVSFIALFLIG